MRDDDDDRPKPKSLVQKANLDPLSIGQLNDYIAELETEIARARADITKKQSVRGAADAAFKR
jgi:uncharacterized small protein (DUF1192 family)